MIFLKISVKQHVKEVTSCKAAQKFAIIVCNCRVNFDKIYPRDNITASPGLCGGGAMVVVRRSYIREPNVYNAESVNTRDTHVKGRFSRI